MAEAGEKDPLVSYRLESAKEKLKAAVALLADGDYKDSVSRSYYAIFTAARALLATKRLDSSKHSGVIALFNQHFVKLGVVSKETSKLIERAKVYRERADCCNGCAGRMCNSFDEGGRKRRCRLSQGLVGQGR